MLLVLLPNEFLWFVYADIRFFELSRLSVKRHVILWFT